MSQKILRDAIHGYISLDDMFIFIIDSPEFQRLKSIEQGSFRVLYPAARHDRFIHSLGTYHLAKKVSHYFIQNIDEDLNISIDKQILDKILTTFYYASLLHDIGHAPFSHTTECFFAEKTIDGTYSNNAIEEQLLISIKEIVDDSDFNSFKKDFKGCSPSSHEIMSATILVKKADIFLECVDSINLELAARMVIGCTYDYNTCSSLSDDEKNILGIKNCFIRLLNSNTVDVDKMDYITRDTVMSGFDNVSIDVERLARSVTAIKNPNGWIYPAFRKNALSVIDNVFRAKTEQGFWMVSHPAVLYNSLLLTHCIKSLNHWIDKDYTNKIFSLESLSNDGIILKNKKYRLLNDIDIGSDLRAYYEQSPLIQELYNRRTRRHPLWKSYYEYKYLFNRKKSEENVLSEENVFLFFKGLIDYMASSGYFVLNDKMKDDIYKNGTDEAKIAVKFLETFCKSNSIKFDFVILSSSNAFGAKFDPDFVYIYFNKLPSNNGRNYATYGFLKNNIPKYTSSRMFYLYSKEKFSPERIENFINDLNNTIKENAQKQTPRA